MRILKARTIKTKIILSILLLLICWMAITSRLDNVIDQYLFFGLSDKSTHYINDTIQRATVTYAILRSSNALISIIQESEIKLPGVNIALGQALNPINDLIEKCSWVMLLSLTSLGIQKILLMISPFLGIQLILSFGLFILFIRIWWPWKCKNMNCKRVAVQLVILALVLRFCIPAMVMVNDFIYKRFLETDHIEANSRMEEINTDLTQFNWSWKSLEDEKEKGFWNKVINTFDFDEKVDRLKNRFFEIRDCLDAVVKDLVNWIVVFVLQTVLIPIGFLWVVVKFLKSVFGIHFNNRISR